MTISRRPNKRESIEKPPGPKKANAAAITATRAAACLSEASSGSHCGSHDKAIPPLSKAARTLPIGVRNPNSTDTPLATAIRVIIQLDTVESEVFTSAYTP